jgi:hypothetical protein
MQVDSLLFSKSLKKSMAIPFSPVLVDYDEVKSLETGSR